MIRVAAGKRTTESKHVTPFFPLNPITNLIIRDSHLFSIHKQIQYHITNFPWKQYSEELALTSHLLRDQFLSPTKSNPDDILPLTPPSEGTRRVYKN